MFPCMCFQKIMVRLKNKIVVIVTIMFARTFYINNFIIHNKYE
jgi:hypothetical protein